MPGRAVEAVKTAAMDTFVVTSGAAHAPAAFSGVSHLALAVTLASLVVAVGRIVQMIHSFWNSAFMLRFRRRR